MVRAGFLPADGPRTAQVLLQIVRLSVHPKRRAPTKTEFPRASSSAATSLDRLGSLSLLSFLARLPTVERGDSTSG